MFKTPIIFNYTSKEEKEYRRSLATYLNTHWKDEFKSTTLLEQSNSNVVYKAKTLDSVNKIFKFMRSESNARIEVNALRYWRERGIRTPEIYRFENIQFNGHATFLIDMEFIEGENLLSLIQKQDFKISKEHGVKMAKILESLNFPYHAENSDYPHQTYQNTTKKNISDFIEIQNSIKKAQDIYNSFLKTGGNMSLLHGDFREGNLIKSKNDIAIIDPGPSLGHPYSDFSYYYILANMHEMTTHLKAFSAEYLKNKNQLELLWVILILEGLRMYDSWKRQKSPKITSIKTFIRNLAVIKDPNSSLIHFLTQNNS